MVFEQMILSNVGFGNDVGIQEGSIVYEVLYFMFEAEVIVGFVTAFLVVVAIFTEALSGRYGIGHWAWVWVIKA